MCWFGVSTYRVRLASTSWRSRRFAPATLVPVENGQNEPTPSEIIPPCATFVSSSAVAPIEGFLSPRGAISRHSQAIDGGTKCVMPMIP